MRDIRDTQKGFKTNVSALTQSPNSSSSTVVLDGFTANALVVCIFPFTAEYQNELSCALGDVFKLMDSKIINGWVLAMSLASGTKGWIPKDNIKILDLHNNRPTNTLDFATSIGPSTSMESSMPASRNLTSTASTNSLPEDRSPSCNYESTSIPLPSSSPLSVFPTSVLYSSIFVHSMYSIDDKPTEFWYRIDLVMKSPNNDGNNSDYNNSTCSTEKVHIARYFEDIENLHNQLVDTIKKNEMLKSIKLPSLPVLNYSHDQSVNIFSLNISNINKYFQSIFTLINSMNSNNPLYLIFLNFLKISNNDFQHYVELDDDQILKILTPSKNDTDIEVNFTDENLNNKSPLFEVPRIGECLNRFSTNSKNSTTSKSSLTINNGKLKIKLIYKEEFSIIKMQNTNLTFKALSTAISENLNINSKFTLAYKNNNGIFILLRDDSGLERALNLNNHKITIKVI